jgi:hypothetical protein
MLADAMHGDALAMFMAMQQHSALMAGAGANFPGARPGMPPMSLPPKGPMGHRTPGQPTPEQMMMASAEISRCVVLAFLGLCCAELCLSQSPKAVCSYWPCVHLKGDYHCAVLCGVIKLCIKAWPSASLTVCIMACTYTTPCPVL